MSLRGRSAVHRIRRYLRGNTEFVHDDWWSVMLACHSNNLYSLRIFIGGTPPSRPAGNLSHEGLNAFWRHQSIFSLHIPYTAAHRSSHRQERHQKLFNLRCICGGFLEQHSSSHSASRRVQQLSNQPTSAAGNRAGNLGQMICSNEDVRSV